MGSRTASISPPTGRDLTASHRGSHHRKGAEILFVVPSADYFAPSHYTLLCYLCSSRSGVDNLLGFASRGALRLSARTR